MPIGHTGKVWIAMVCLLLVIIISGAVLIWVRFPHNHPIEISIGSQSLSSSAGIYVDGAVNNPGYYSLKTGENLDTLLQLAGGTTNNADYNNIKLYIPSTGETEPTQKIDINRAESWLLEALPGIGSTLSRRIIEYREQHGPFQNINELTMVDGITVNLYEKIKPLITVSD